MTSDNGEGVNPRALGLAAGTLWGTVVLLLALLSRTGWGEQWRVLLGDAYIGYDETITGSLIGAGWGFVDGAIAGVALGWLYNRFDDRS
jgi:hypothetical protein